MRESQSSTSLETSGSNTPWPNRKYAWTVVVVLTAAYVLAFIDRVILGLLLELIRVDLSISDIQVSLLGGLAFALFYVVMGFPLGWLADRYNRRNIIAIGVLVWSFMTVLCGLAREFYQLFLARVGVGVGEAALTPAALSIIADYFPPERRHAAIATYMSAVALGAGFAFISGGVIVNFISGIPDFSLPLLGKQAAWQVTFFVVGLPGLVLGMIIFILREPARRGIRRNVDMNSTEKHHVTVKEVLNFIFRENRKTFLSLFLAFGGFGLYGFALLMWLPAHFIRSFGWSEIEIGLSYGTIILIFGSIGMFASPKFVDWLRSRGHEDALMRAALYMGIAMTPFAVCCTLLSDPYMTLLAVIPVSMLSFGMSTIAPGIMQVITPNQMRAQVGAVYSFVNNVMGMMIGGTLVALITELVFKDPKMLGYSLATTAVLVLPGAIYLMAIGLKPFTSSLCSAQNWIHSAAK